MSYKKMLPLVLAALLLWTVPASAAPETTLKVNQGKQTLDLSLGLPLPGGLRSA